MIYLDLDTLTPFAKRQPHLTGVGSGTDLGNLLTLKQLRRLGALVGAMPGVPSAPRMAVAVQLYPQLVTYVKTGGPGVGHGSGASRRKTPQRSLIRFRLGQVHAALQSEVNPHGQVIAQALRQRAEASEDHTLGREDFALLRGDARLEHRLRTAKPTIQTGAALVTYWVHYLKKYGFLVQVPYRPGSP